VNNGTTGIGLIQNTHKKSLTVIITDRPILTDIDSECSVVSAGTARGVNNKHSLCRPTVCSGRKVKSGLKVNNLIQPQLLRHVFRPSVSLTCGTLNVRSLRHKVDAVDDMIFYIFISPNKR